VIDVHNHAVPEAAIELVGCARAALDDEDVAAIGEHNPAALYRW
jgi:hypothetical protein